MTCVLYNEDVSLVPSFLPKQMPIRERTGRADTTADDDLKRLRQQLVDKVKCVEAEDCGIAPEKSAVRGMLVLTSRRSVVLHRLERIGVGNAGRFGLLKAVWQLRIASRGTAAGLQRPLHAHC